MNRTIEKNVISPIKENNKTLTILNNHKIHRNKFTYGYQNTNDF